MKPLFHFLVFLAILTLLSSVVITTTVKDPSMVHASNISSYNYYKLAKQTINGSVAALNSNYNKASSAFHSHQLLINAANAANKNPLQKTTGLSGTKCSLEHSMKF